MDSWFGEVGAGFDQPDQLAEFGVNAVGERLCLLRRRVALGDRVGELPVDHAADEIIEALALNDRNNVAVVFDVVVAGGQRAPLGARLLSAELVGATLAGVDEDRETRELGGAPTGDTDPGSGLSGGAR